MSVLIKELYLNKSNRDILSEVLKYLTCTSRIEFSTSIKNYYPLICENCFTTNVHTFPMGCSIIDSSYCEYHFCKRCYLEHNKKHTKFEQDVSERYANYCLYVYHKCELSTILFNIDVLKSHPYIVIERDVVINYHINNIPIDKSAIYMSSSIYGISSIIYRSVSNIFPDIDTILKNIKE